MKTRHVNRNFLTKAKAPKTEVNKGKEKFDVENIKAGYKEDMAKKRWIKFIQWRGHFTQEVK